MNNTQNDLLVIREECMVLREAECYRTWQVSSSMSIGTSGTEGDLVVLIYRLEISIAK